jgi:hypothetical protein
MKAAINNKYLILAIKVLIILFASTVYSQNYFPEPITSPLVCDFLGKITINGLPASPGDEIAFFNSQGNICARFVVKQSGLYGFLHVYGDDPASQTIEGAYSGEKLLIQVWDSIHNILFTNHQIFLSPGDTGGSAIPSPIPPVFQSNNRYVLNIDAKKLTYDINRSGKTDIQDIIHILQFLSR